MSEASTFPRGAIPGQGFTPAPRGCRGSCGSGRLAQSRAEGTAGPDWVRWLPDHRERAQSRRLGVARPGCTSSATETRAGRCQAAPAASPGGKPPRLWAAGGSPGTAPAEWGRGGGHLHTAVSEGQAVSIAGQALLLAVIGAGGRGEGVAGVDVVGVDRLPPRSTPANKEVC